jgi:hypothetical protein
MPENTKTGYTVEIYNSVTGVWSRAEGPWDDEVTAQSHRREVLGVLQLQREREMFLEYTHVRILATVVKTSVVGDAIAVDDPGEGV